MAKTAANKKKPAKPQKPNRKATAQPIHPSTKKSFPKPTSTAIILPSHIPARSDAYLALFAQLVSQLPRDNNGFLTQLLDHEMIPPDFEARDNQDRKNHLDAAKLPIYNVEGYPAYDFHKPIWSQLPNEPQDYYEAFEHYLMSHERSLEAANNQLPNHSAYALKEIYTFYFWAERSRAYDIFRPVAAARLREQRSLQMIDSHYNLTNELMRTLVKEIQDRSIEQKGRPFQGLNARDLFLSIKDTMEVQRVTNGLPAKGPSLNNVGQPAPFSSMERNVREAAEHYNGSNAGAETESVKLRREMDKAIANNPDLAEQLQQQVIDMMDKARGTMNENEE